MKHPVVRQLADIRRSQKLSQDEVADRIGCELGTIKKWEYGARMPTAYKLTKWASVLGFELVLEPKMGAGE